MEILSTSELYLEPCQAGLKFSPIPTVTKMTFRSMTDIGQGSEFASDHDTVTFSLESYNKKEGISYEFTWFQVG